MRSLVSLHVGVLKSEIQLDSTSPLYYGSNVAQFASDILQVRVKLIRRHAWILADQLVPADTKSGKLGKFGAYFLCVPGSLY